MDTIQNLNQLIFNQKCRQHPSYCCEFINLNGEFFTRRVCYECMVSQKIPLEELLPLRELLEAQPNSIIRYYPPLKDPKLSQQLKERESIEAQIEKIDKYFTKIKGDIDVEIEKARSKAKSQFIEKIDLINRINYEYQRIAQIKKLQEIVYSQKQNQFEELDSFIKKMWEKAEENSQIFQTLLQKDLEMKTNQPLQTINQIVQAIQSIEFFKILEEETENLIKSTYLNSPNLSIEKKLDGSFEIICPSTGGGQAFFNSILDPSKLYLIRLEFEYPSINSTSNGFFFGICEDDKKNTDWCHCVSYLSYFDDDAESYGISKKIKGKLRSKDRKSMRSLEMRIHLQTKYMRVGSFPDYSSIVEIDNPNNLDLSKNYVFFIILGDIGDKMTIRKIINVVKFDHLME